MENEKLITGDELRTMNLPLKAGKDHLSGSMCITKDELISHYVVDETLLENMRGNKLVTHGQVRRRYNPDDFITGNILASLGLKLRNGKQPTSGSDFVTKKVIEETYHVKKSLLKDFKDNDFIPCRYVQAPGKDVE